MMSGHFERNHAAPEVCGTCIHHIYDPAECEWLCTCDDSDYYAVYTEHESACECWEVRE